MHLRLQGARRELAPVAGVFKIRALAEGVVDVPEGHERPQQLGEGSGNRDVVCRGAGGDAGDLRVHGWVGEDQAAARQQDLLVGLVEGRVQRHLARQHTNVLDGVVRGALAGAQGVRGLTKFQFESEIELRREEFARLEHPDERGRHQDVLEALRRDGRRRAADLPEARDAPVSVPFLRLE